MFRPLRHCPPAFHALHASRVQAGSPRRPRRPPTRRCPPLEQLEGRIVLSAFHVTTLADDGAGSLRDAITQANTRVGADIIVFDSRLTGTIALTGGELDISDDLAINGPGAGRLTISGSNRSRVFEVGSGAAVRLSGLTIACGDAGTGNGGGIDNFGRLTIDDSVFSGNTATGGGGLANEGSGTVTVRDSTFTDNTAPAGSGGGLFSSSGTVTVRDSTFTDNTAAGSGGGLFNSSGTVTVRDSVFTDNSADRPRWRHQQCRCPRDIDGERQHLHRQHRLFPRRRYRKRRDGHRQRQHLHQQLGGLRRRRPPQRFRRRDDGER